MIRDFLVSRTAWDWTCIGLGSWLILAVITGVSIGRSIKQADEQEQPEVAEPRDWYCTDGLWRTEADAADWCAETDGSLAKWLAAWPTDADTLYVPREWVA